MLFRSAIHLANPDLISICPTNPQTGKAEACLRGMGPARGDLLEVILVGSLAGLLSALLPLSRVQRVPSPYSLPTAQVMLKAPAGGAAALVGILLMQGEVFTGLARQSGSGILAYAALFGFAQQLLSGLVDRRASSLLGSDASEAHAGSAIT